MTTSGREETETVEGKDITQLSGPDGIPLLNNTVAVGWNPIRFSERLQEHGDIVPYEAYGTQFIAVLDPKLVQEVLVARDHEFRKGDFENEFAERFAPNGVAFTEGDQWRQQRMLLQSIVTPERIQGYCKEIVSTTVDRTEDWSAEGTVKLGVECSDLALDILTRTLFDLSFGDEQAETVRRAAKSSSRFFAPRQWALQSILPSWLKTPTEYRYERSMAEVRHLIETLVAEHRRGDDTTSGRTLLSLLATAEYSDGKLISPSEVRDQIVTLLFGGHETTATALSTTIWLLANNRQICNRLDRELTSVLDSTNPDFEDLTHLKYTEAVVKEALRLYPPAIDIHREPIAATTLGGYNIDPDTTIHLPVYPIHRDERWWDDPDTFRPDRWLQSDAERPEYAFFPFSGGPRHCLGMRFAMTTLQLVIAVLGSHLCFERVTESLNPSIGGGMILHPGPAEVKVTSK